MASDRAEDAEETPARLEARTQETIAEMRRLIYGLRPPALDDLGLVHSIRQQATGQGMLEGPEHVGAAERRENGTVFSIEAPEELPKLPAAVEVACYRIAQEAITNVSRHTQAGTCRVRFSVDRAAVALELEISDDGEGLPEERVAGVGLSSMRERAEELGGTLTIAPGRGTARGCWRACRSTRPRTVPRERRRGWAHPRPHSRRPRRRAGRAARRGRLRAGSGGRGRGRNREGGGRAAAERRAHGHPDAGDHRIEATRLVLDHDPRVGVVVLTMFEDDDSVASAMRAGARGYVLKGARLPKS